MFEPLRPERDGATPDFKALVAAAEAIQMTRRIVEQTCATREDLERVAGPVAALLAPVVTPAEPAPSGRAWSQAGRRSRRSSRGNARASGGDGRTRRRPGAARSMGSIGF